MLPYFIGIPIYKNICKVVFIGLAFLFFSYKSHAQSLGDPIVHITFGSGSSSYGPPLAADSGTTTYRYSGSISPNDGDYSIFKSTAGLNRGWVFTTDHTGDNGYMMIVNASFAPGLFYTRNVSGLCGSTTYQFSAYIKNILKGKGILPNVNFSIEALDGTVLGVGATGNIQADSTWKQFPFTFTTPATAQTIVLKMTNNAPGGGGNDIAIDDITFSPYGSQVTAQFEQANTIFCLASPQPITIKTITPLDPNYAQKFQANINGVWVDQGPAGTASSFSFLSPTVAGSYSYRVVKSDAGNINTSSCVVSSNQLNITVLPLPVPVFSVADTTCQSDSVVFKDQSIAQGSAVASWLWSFGDGQTSVKKKPSHLYANGGNYTVKLTVTNNSGCISSTTATKIIHIISQVNTSFSYSTPDCETKAVTFTDASVPVEGNITSREWDYGDSIKETRPDNLPFQHTFAKSGSYPVKLLITTDKGCISTLTKTVIINPLPIVNFGIPPTCTEDYSKFTDSTTVANGTSLTYLWNFGDANSNAGNPNTSTQQNPVHRFIVAQNYLITLTVTSVNGCQVTRTKSFMVNGSNPTAAYNVLNSNYLCSNREVFFVNHSYTTPGKITKIKWYFDSSDTTVQLTDNNTYAGKLYPHKYPAVTFPQASKNYTVRMVAYSGGRCPSVPLDTTITILATPVLTFTPPDSVCLNNGPIQFNATESTGIAGAAVYSGPGVSALGKFDPAMAGIGDVTVKCIFTANGAACADTLTRVINVKPIPTVNAGDDVAILAGNTTMLHATATGSNITYSWSPATGLSNSTIPDPVVTPMINTTYTLTVTNSFGCSVSDMVTVTALQPPVIPNAFTPNGDGINDLWIIKYLDTYTDCTVDIFNRNGQKIYTSTGYTTAWDGRFNGGNMPIGVYYYVINPKHGRKSISGYVTIIR
ncbi:MAG: type sorting protein [Mucilaginibacter sp.]|uniref:PKD domain-containing protein n=1 Tax=Mucilaginibacter sp. TaxID=1882438 RepID=UPI0026254D6E|nr:PKD domain-containing protein [Mucilaginibacter sp.]MDB5004088.1 type sorting protein [Mucilaginibacter sp.]